MVDANGTLPAKLYFRIGEVAELIGVEPHVLRYWEREFRAIRPTKSAKGQRVYSRRDVENLMRVRELLYREGFTIAGAKKKLQRAGIEPEVEIAAQLQAQAGVASPTDGRGPSEPKEATKMRETLLSVRGEIEAFLLEIERPTR